LRNIASTGQFGSSYQRQALAARTELSRRFRRNTYKRLGILSGVSILGNMAYSRLGKRFRVGRGFRRRVRFRGATSMATARTSRPRPAGVRSGQGVTVQHDARRIYQSRRMPRRMRRRWKKFSNKVHAVSEKDLGTRTVVLNKAVTYGNSTAGDHCLAYLALYSANGTGDSFMGDLATLSALENTGNPTVAGGITVDDSTKWIFKSAILDITVRNSSIQNAALGAEDFVSEAKLEVDVYEIISNREWTTSDAAYSDITSAFGKGTGATKNIGGAGTGLALANRGVTPWDVPLALSYWRMKILRKTKYFVNNNDTFTYQIRDPKRRIISQENMEKILGGNKPKWTRHLLIIAKLVPGLTVGPNLNEYEERVTIGITRKYFYKIEGANEDRDRLLANT